MGRITITSACHHIHYHTRYRTFSLRLKWIGHNAVCYHNFDALPRVTVNFIKKYILIVFQKKCGKRGSALQIAQNLANFRENVW